jgi:hypothetical protein
MLPDFASEQLFLALSVANGKRYSSLALTLSFNPVFYFADACAHRVQLSDALRWNPT